ncbi:MAG TPA: 2-phosphosulfolactate phosphatase [Paenibacillus sp.]|uniref:2-phosphosulfolactate phosphatase n=1 Tax=Paenibacillus sp. TaxID=58172 RepID=UPI0028D8C6E2|nr:2-phosphosulfolactate phosphatase [Paenibacillus sp.]HUC90867.1 2-phosphosulfolactate phosphatase [Paenibacillus sp.]
MKVQVIPNAGEARADQFLHKTAVVIDVLRATSTIVTALAEGASGILSVETVMEAKAMHRTGDLLGGERFGRKIAGFDLGNSPEEYVSGCVYGRRVILTTTNGTRAIHKAARSDHVLAGSLLNAEACAEAAVVLRRDIVLFCAGTHDEFALEDGLCAGLLLDRMTALSGTPIEADDLGRAMLGFYRQSAADMYGTLLQSASGRRMSKLGFGKDVEFCAQVNRFDAVPRLSGDTMTIV